MSDERNDVEEARNLPYINLIDEARTIAVWMNEQSPTRPAAQDLRMRLTRALGLLPETSLSSPIRRTALEYAINLLEHYNEGEGTPPFRFSWVTYYILRAHDGKAMAEVDLQRDIFEERRRQA